MRGGHGDDRGARADLPRSVRTRVGDAHARPRPGAPNRRDSRLARSGRARGRARRAAAPSHRACCGRDPRCPRHVRRAPPSRTARSRRDRRESDSRAPRRCGMHRDAGGRGTRGTSRRLGAGVRAGGWRRPCPRARRCRSRMYASASRFTFRPARANETRPSGGNGRRNGSSSGRVSRTIRPPRWTFSIDPVIGFTSSPSSVTSCPIDGIGRREHVRADAEGQVAALLRPDASADALRRLEHDRVVIAEAVRSDEAGDPPADDDDVTFLDHGAALLRSSACGVAKPTPYTSESALRAGRALVVTHRYTP